MTYRILMQATTGLLFLLSTHAQAFNEGDRKSFTIARTTSAPVIDGRIDEDAWRFAAIVDDFHQTVPTDGATPTEHTIVRVMYDDEYLYIAADLRDSNPGAIQALQLIQGRLFFSDDRFWVTLDSFNSKRNDYLFQVNANGVRREALRENNSGISDPRERMGDGNRHSVQVDLLLTQFRHLGHQFWPGHRAQAGIRHVVFARSTGLARILRRSQRHQ